jgi:hypothetical protein
MAGHAMGSHSFGDEITEMAARFEFIELGLVAAPAKGRDLGIENRTSGI